MAAATWARVLPQSRAAVAHSIPIIRKIITTDHFRTSGLTTAEIFSLALKEPAPINFEKYEVPAETDIRYIKSGRTKSPPPSPPHPAHPVRSIQFLKKQILPVLQGSREIRMTTGKRLLTVTDTKTAPAPTKYKGKDRETSAPSPVSHTVHLWMPGQKQGVKKIVSDSSIPAFASENWDHLNKRRRHARDEKFKHDVALIVRARKDENQEKKRLAWQERVQRLERRKGKNQQRYQRWQQQKAAEGQT
ncbi:hypothetical protein D9757_004396 [Collybiopsis confluens]|uniref:Uncharacterized protein n=1 Tax=Collybiopsis confluens TaxID=2823264 RepID=A0A8H5HU28_9AGAR|nr:hypothetical protein D9757_004396 [Collybiopsis confluens]